MAQLFHGQAQGACQSCHSFALETSNPTQEAFQTLERAGLVNADLIQLKKEATTLVQMVAWPVQEDERKVSNFAADYIHIVNNQYFEL